MDFIITRQDQELVMDNDTTYCDLQLVHAHIELVGDNPLDMSTAGALDNARLYNIQAGTQTGIQVYNTSTINQGGQTSDLYNHKLVNSIYTHSTAINHGWANVAIEGMLQDVHFLRDTRYTIHNNTALTIPSDLGSIGNRMNIMSFPTHPRKLEKVRMQSRLTVKTHWLGNAPIISRTAMFAEDFADKDPSTFRNQDQTIKYWDASAPQIPASCINYLFMTFRVTPRVDL